jgi:hypothetical protein
MEEGLIRRAKTSCLFLLGLLFSVSARLELDNVMRIEIDTLEYRQTEKIEIELKDVG